MKIKFNGVIETKKRGCPVCGGKRQTNQAFTYSKTYILPSGVTKHFRVGRVEEVSEKDAEFLLSYQYKTPTGEVKKVFEVCEA